MFAACIILFCHVAFAADALDDGDTYGEPPRPMPSLQVPRPDVPADVSASEDIPARIAALDAERRDLDPLEASLSTRLRQERAALREAEADLDLYKTLARSMTRFVSAASSAELGGIDPHLRQCARVYESDQQWIAPRLHGCMWRVGRIQARLLCADTSASPHARAFGCRLSHAMSEFLLTWIVKDKNHRFHNRAERIGGSFQQSVDTRIRAVSRTSAEQSRVATRRDQIAADLARLEAVDAQLVEEIHAHASAAQRVGLQAPRVRSLAAVQQWSAERVRRERIFVHTMEFDATASRRSGGRALRRDSHGRCKLQSASARKLLELEPFDNAATTYKKEGIPCEAADLNGDGVNDYLLLDGSGSSLEERRHAALVLLNKNGSLASLDIVAGPGFSIVEPDGTAPDGAQARVALGGEYVERGSARLVYLGSADRWELEVPHGEDLDKTVAVADMLAQNRVCKGGDCMAEARTALTSDAAAVFRCLSGEAGHCIPAAAEIAALMDESDPAAALEALEASAENVGRALYAARREDNDSIELCEDQPAAVRKAPEVSATCSIQHIANGLAMRSADPEGIAWLQAALFPRVVARVRPVMRASVRQDFAAAWRAEQEAAYTRKKFFPDDSIGDRCLPYRAVALHLADRTCRGGLGFQEDVLQHIAEQELPGCRLEAEELLINEVIVQDLPAYRLSDREFRDLPTSAVKRELCSLVTTNPEVTRQLEAMRDYLKIRIVVANTLDKAMCMNEDLLDAPDPWVREMATHHAVRCEALALMNYGLYTDAFEAGLFYTEPAVLQRFWRESIDSRGGIDECRQLEEALKLEDVPRLKDSVDALGDRIRLYSGGTCQYLIEAALGAARVGPLDRQEMAHAAMTPGRSGGADPDEPVEAHWSRVKNKRMPQFRFPEAAKRLNMTEEVCKVRFFIDEEGIPYDIAIEECPQVFHAELEEKAYKARFYPHKSGGQPVRAQFVLTIRFKLR